MPFLSAGILLLNKGNTVDRYTSKRQDNGTNANCTIVRVTGFGRAFKMDFEDVFVTAEVMYQMRQRICYKISHGTPWTSWSESTHYQPI